LVWCHLAARPVTDQKNVGGAELNATIKYVPCIISQSKIKVCYLEVKLHTK
jgi:hypothetical protein